MSDAGKAQDAAPKDVLVRPIQTQSQLARYLGQARPPVARFSMLVMYRDDHELTVEMDEHYGVLEALQEL